MHNCNHESSLSKRCNLLVMKQWKHHPCSHLQHLVSLKLIYVLLFQFSVCVIHHFERLGFQIDLFNSFWYTIVTFSTVGYGDVYPGHWTGKALMIVFIVSALIYLPTKVRVIQHIMLTCTCAIHAMFVGHPLAHLYLDQLSLLVSVLCVDWFHSFCLCEALLVCLKVGCCFWLVPSGLGN